MQVCFLLLLIQLHVTEGCRLRGSRETIPIIAYAGGSVLLSCSCTDLHTTPKRFTWFKVTNENKYVEISPESELYKDRFRLVNNHSTGNLSLLISHLTVEDAGVYRCSVTTSEYRHFRLTVKGCRQNQQTVSVTGYVGQSVLLPCSCSHLQAKPHTLRWIFLKGSHKEIFPKDQTNRYTHRVQLSNDPPAYLSLLISHLTVEDEGRYRCQINNTNNMNINLTVKETTRNPDPHYIIICTAAGVLLLLLLILGGVMYWKHRGWRRGQTEIGDGQTGQRTQQEQQDRSDVLYTVIDPQTPCNNEEEK
ncbi:polymeric immunoglobulin receptor-like, partial [Clarias magur]